MTDDSPADNPTSNGAEALLSNYIHLKPFHINELLDCFDTKLDQLIEAADDRFICTKLIRLRQQGLVRWIDQANADFIPETIGEFSKALENGKSYFTEGFPTHRVAASLKPIDELCETLIAEAQRIVEKNKVEIQGRIDKGLIPQNLLPPGGRV